MSDRPNIVLVHGAWADGSCWSGVIERLQASGYNVTAPQFALGAIADDVAKLRLVLGRQKGPTVVAGHSYGGQIITVAGRRRAECDRARLHRGVRAGRGRVDRRAARAGPADAGAGAPRRGRARLRVAAGGRLRRALRRRRGSREGAGDVRRAAAPLDGGARRRPGRPGVEVAAVVVPGGRERRGDSARRRAAVRLAMGATTVEVASSHVAMVSQPDAVVQLIEAAANSTPRKELEWQRIRGRDVARRWPAAADQREGRRPRDGHDRFRRADRTGRRHGDPGGARAFRLRRRGRRRQRAGPQRGLRRRRRRRRRGAPGRLHRDGRGQRPVPADHRSRRRARAGRGGVAGTALAFGRLLSRRA